jgi:hypothetical protein
MLRPLDTAQVLRVAADDTFVAMRGCPDCGGRGWFCDNPLAEYNKVYVQCPTCLAAKQHVDEHGSLPLDIAAAMTALQR